MAEERLIDDDKDRKYKIVKNADGEDELVIDYTPEEEAEELTPLFDLPDDAEDDEEAALLTPEQLAERERLRQEEERLRAERVASFLEKGGAKLAEGDFESASYAASQALELDGQNGAAYCLKLRALSRDFSDYTALDECEEAADGVRQYADLAQKAELQSVAAGMQARIRELREETELLSRENEEKKAERRSLFAQKRKGAVRHFVIAAVPFVVFLVLAVSFSTVMFAVENGAYLIVTVVCAVLALLSLIVLLVMSNRLWSAMRSVRQNERDTATKLGRKYLEKKGELDLLERIYTSFDENL